MGLSATVRDPDELRRWLVPQRGAGEMAELVVAAPGAPPALGPYNVSEVSVSVPALEYVSPAPAVVGTIPPVILIFPLPAIVEMLAVLAEL